MKLYPVILIFFLFYGKLSGQNYTKIIGEVTYKNKPLEQYKINFGGLGEVITKSDGRFELTIGETYEKSEIEFTINDTLVVIEPSNKKLPVLSPKGYVHRIILGSSEDKNEILALRQEINNRLQNIENKAALRTDYILNKIQHSFQEYNKSLGDSIARLHLLNDELKYLIEKEKKMHRIKVVVPKLESVYDFYLSRTKDLRDAMIQYGEKVFYNPTYTGFIQQRIDGYNAAYERLDTSKGSILSNVELYWDEHMFDEVSDFIEDITLHDFHKQVILKSSISVVNSITAFNSREKGRRRKSEIINDINELVVDLNTNIERISSARESIVQELKM